MELARSHDFDAGRLNYDSLEVATVVARFLRLALDESMSTNYVQTPCILRKGCMSSTAFGYAELLASTIHDSTPASVNLPIPQNTTA